MSVGLRDQRVRIYTYSDSGADGFAASRYTFAVERWGRFEVPSASERTLGGKADQQIDGVIALSDEATVTSNDLLQVGDLNYKVTGSRPARQAREILYMVVLADEDTAVVES